MARPCFVFLINSCRRIIIATDRPIVISVTDDTSIPPILKMADGKIFGMTMGSAPKIRRARFCRNMLMPMAVMSIESLGAFLSGR